MIELKFVLGDKVKLKTDYYRDVIGRVVPNNFNVCGICFNDKLNGFLSIKDSGRQINDGELETVMNNFNIDLLYVLENDSFIHTTIEDNIYV